jgi:hypothetical protein
MRRVSEAEKGHPNNHYRNCSYRPAQTQKPT